ncbi:MAG TPA: hypothetical protein VG389_13775 [Myxococcota bacterium]|jgi:hypothetical protein|nr:hypothetical protein [Myxococcota bacterium]
MPSKVPERMRHLDDRRGLVPVGHLPQRAASFALRRSLPTMDHAVRLVAAARALLGDRAWTDPAGGEQATRIHRVAEPGGGWLSPFPVVELVHGHGGSVTLATLVPAEEGSEAEPAPAPAPAPDTAPAPAPAPAPADAGPLPPQLRPRGPTMHAGSLTLREGPSSFALNFDVEGLFRDCVQEGGDIFAAMYHGDTTPPSVDPLARPPTEPPPSILCRADLDPGGHPVDVLARMVAELDPGARAPALARLPSPVPIGAQGVWNVALPALRRALFGGTVDADARFAVADGMEGTAAAWGASLEDAMEAWRGALFRAKPKPPGPPPPPAPPPARAPEPPGTPATLDGPRTLRDAEGKVTGFSTGTITLSFSGDGAPALPWPAAVPDKMPAAAIPLPPLAPAPHASFARAGFADWVRLVGRYGRVLHALVRHDPDGAGFTLIGEGVLDLVDPGALEGEIARAQEEDRARDQEVAAQAGRPSFWDEPQVAWALMYFSCWDDERQARTPLRRRFGAFGPTFDAGALEGDLGGWTVTRVHRLRG